jgi:hypothetical protein
LLKEGSEKVDVGGRKSVLVELGQKPGVPDAVKSTLNI